MPHVTPFAADTLRTPGLLARLQPHAVALLLHVEKGTVLETPAF